AEMLPPRSGPNRFGRVKASAAPSSHHPSPARAQELQGSNRSPLRLRQGERGNPRCPEALPPAARASRSTERANSFKSRNYNHAQDKARSAVMPVGTLPRGQNQGNLLGYDDNRLYAGS